MINHAVNPDFAKKRSRHGRQGWQERQGKEQATAVDETETRGAKVANGIGGGAGEALVVVGTKLAEHGIGFGQGGGAGEAKFADQTVLTGAPGAFDAALSLGRVGGDLLNAEFFQS